MNCCKRLFDVIIVAGGKSERAGCDKLDAVIDGRQTVLQKAVNAFADLQGINSVIIGLPEGKALPSFSDRVEIKRAPSGDTRYLTVKNCLALCTAPYVMIHDGARPYLGRKLLEKLMDETAEKGSAVPCLPLTDTIITSEFVPADRKAFLAVQTPQCFKTEQIIKAYSAYRGEATDDATVYYKYAQNVNYVPGETSNRKITYPEDLIPRTGIGYDIHRLETGRRLVLCGVEIPFEKGLAGHSDADCAVHAVMDAALSAAGLRDIGFYFSDTDDSYKNADSVLLLSRVCDILKERGLKIAQASISIIAEKPKLAVYMDKMINKLSDTLNIEPGHIGISATTNEQTGLIGKGEAIAAWAAVTLVNA